jgi:hypothetical protein
MGFNLGDLARAQKPEGGNFPVLEAGLYPASINKATVKTSQAGNTYIQIELDVKDFEGNNKGKVWHNLFPEHEKLAWQVSHVLKALGIDIAELGDGDMEYEELCKLLEKGQCLINTKVEKDNKDRDKAVIDTFGTMEGFAPLDDVDKWYSIIVEGKDPSDTPADTSFMDVKEGEDEEIPFI